MNEPHVCDTKQIYLQSDSALQFTPSRIIKIGCFFVAEINNRKDEQNT